MKVFSLEGLQCMQKLDMLETKLSVLLLLLIQFIFREENVGNILEKTSAPTLLKAIHHYSAYMGAPGIAM